MAYTDVEIAKMALSHVGDRFDLTSLSDATPEAEQVNLFYAKQRDRLLEDHPWPFATRYKDYDEADQLTGTPPDSWTYWFAYPTDGARIQYIVNPLGRVEPPIRFKVGYTNADAKVLMCDEAAPQVIYTKQITDPALFSDGFAHALSYRLAWLIQRPLVGDIVVSEGEVAREVGRGMSMDANESVEEEQSRDPDWLRARL